MAAPVIIGTATQGQVLSITLGDWASTPTSYARQWMRCDAAGANAVLIPSATGAWYKLVAADVGKTIRCWVSAFNAVGVSDALLTAQTGVVGAIAAGVPVLVTAPTISGVATVGQTLTCSDGTWTGSPTSYTHCWDRCDTAGANCADIAGQNCSTYNPTYVLQAADVGKTIRVYTTAINATGSSTPVLSATTAVVSAGAAPPPSGSLIYNGKPTTTTVVPPWDIVLQAASGRITSVTSDAGVTPRLPGRMIRVEVRSGDAPWGQGNAAMLLRDEDNLHHGSGPGDDIYTGWSQYLPANFPFIPNSLYNYFFEWHGNTSAVQASVKTSVDTIVGSHYGITNPSSGFCLELHTQTGFNPQMFRFGNVITGAWVDFVVRTKWSTTSTGRITGWMNGVQKFDFTGVTWYPYMQATRVNQQLGYYRSATSATAVAYFDAFKTGTTREIVDPANG